MTTAIVSVRHGFACSDNLTRVRFLRQDIPEITVAVPPGCRGRGAGGELLRALAEAAAASRFTDLCLSVAADNPAMRLYERLGYTRVVLDAGGSWTMRLRLGVGPQA